MFLVNGKQKHCIDIADRGFQYGDGLFETIAIYRGIPVFLAQHLARLEQGCERLLIPFPGRQLLTDEIYRLIDTTFHAVLKLTLTRGCGGRGYRPPENATTSRVLSLHPYPDYPDFLAQQGINARFCTFRLGVNPRLAGLKHLNRLEQVLARAEWQDHNIREGIMMDIHGHIIEGTMSNLFCVKNGTVFTPILDVNGVEGVIRSVILNSIGHIGLKCELTRLNKADILGADELFVTNSIIGVWPIRQIGKYSFEVGPITRRVESLVEQCQQQDIKKCGCE